MKSKDVRDIAEALKCQRDGRCYHLICPYKRGRSSLDAEYCARNAIYNDAIEIVERACVDCEYYHDDSFGSMPGHFICFCTDSPTFNRHVDGDFCCAKFEKKN